MKSLCFHLVEGNCNNSFLLRICQGSEAEPTTEEPSQQEAIQPDPASDTQQQQQQQQEGQQQQQQEGGEGAAGEGVIKNVAGEATTEGETAPEPSPAEGQGGDPAPSEPADGTSTGEEATAVEGEQKPQIFSCSSFKSSIYCTK